MNILARKNVGTNNIPVHTLKDNRLPNLETLQHFPKLVTFLHGALITYIFFLIFQYSPQVWLNFKRKSTTGFHIGGVLLDFGGGVLSLLQMDIYCFIEHSINQLTGNIPKMALAVVTLLFNIILVWQHYVFYLGNELVGADEQKPLLRGAKKTKFYSVDVNSEEGDFQVTSLSLSVDENLENPRSRKSNSQESLV